MAKLSIPGPIDPYFLQYLQQSGPRPLTKWLHYLTVYSRELGPFRTRPVTFLEIGVFRGGSMPFWRGYFHPESVLVFVDINPDCADLEIEGTHVRIGDQSDPEFLARLVAEFGPFDCILDDGSHVCAHQITSFERLWPHLTDGGLYMVEDTHTSYWKAYGGGYRQQGSFIEYAKDLLDAMHAWYSEQDTAFPFDPRAQSLSSVRVYDSIVAIEKRWQPDPPAPFAASNGALEIDRTWLAKTKAGARDDDTSR
ncbi:class I SAM-dependent methyltransferase [Cognatishimia sp. F0-27]|uniref:class I SAM-dependent methyltransferase n=1 Tax=Cognatishimia sp. F0-27 TaxID=2816855 RepID=UPI001D0C4BC4|nr:class I SAM-dependent methyltransferase [Cognatishimia sp. F0-27]MCC1494770.1 class I SAM-dependent methyltransferase [Cognatishimia sp. F0-27]